MSVPRFEAARVDRAVFRYLVFPSAGVLRNSYRPQANRALGRASMPRLAFGMPCLALSVDFRAGVRLNKCKKAEISLYQP